MKFPVTGLLPFLLFASLTISATGQAAGPSVIDHGLLAAAAPAAPISITIALSLTDAAGAESLLQSIYAPGNAQYHQFLTADQFAVRFAPPDADVARIVSTLATYGLTAEKATATTLHVTGLPADFDRAFNVSLHDYEVPAQGSAPGYHFHAPLTAATIPQQLSGFVSGVVGLDSRPALRPSSQAGLRAATRLAASAAPSTATTADPPGLWTVTDFASYYDVLPLYAKGFTGKGQTIGIITFAALTPSDAFTYWSSLGLTVDPNRLQIVNIDGGPGAPSDASESQETTLDVQQSGGIAPGADIIIYQGPNTNQAFVDAFAAAVDANTAETLSVSWGNWEWLNNLQGSPVTDPISGQIVGDLQATHEQLLRAAIQGQTFFAAAGDSGAYDADYSAIPYCYPSLCSLPLSVDYPSSDPDITAGGGTTLAGLQTGFIGAPQFSVNIPNEQVWNWEYVIPLCADLKMPNIYKCQIFPWGSGGGVSIMFPVPSYQSGIQGVQISQPGQYWQISAKTAAEYQVGQKFDLPPNYAGRNVPDISFNADPNTGYIIPYTSSVSGFSVTDYWGGTSFVAPQLNGVSALIAQSLHVKRLGLLNYPLYQLAAEGKAYAGPNPPVHAIPYSDNWYYPGTDGYNPAVGFGTLDVANFATALRPLF